MIKNKVKIGLLLCVLIIMTGCTKVMKDENNEIVKYDKTGQHLTENILCRPKNKEVIQLYKDNNVNIDDLVECENFQITSGGYEGIWVSFFVKPLAYLILRASNIVGNHGVGLIIVSLLIRFLVNPITRKSAIQTENMKRAKPELESIEKKYKNKNDQETTMKKTQEILMVYKKYKVNPLFGCIFAVIQLPLFISFLEAINRTPAIFEDRLLTFQLGTTPYIGVMEQGNITYIVLILLILLTTYYSFVFSIVSTNKEQEKQMKFTMIIMLFVISYASLHFSAAISFYWISSSIFTIVQNVLIKRSDSEL